MRIDKYLKVSRLIKRRTVAAEAAEQSRIEINGKVAKPSSSVKIGDEITIKMGNREIKVRVCDLTENRQKADSAEMYEAIE